jgi:hypothetical protein
MWSLDKAVTRRTPFEGRRLLAHELTHVIQQGEHVSTGTTAKQQGSVQPSRIARQPVIQRDLAPPTSNVSTTPAPASVVSVSVEMRVSDPQGSGVGTVVMSPNAEDTYQSFRKIGLNNMYTMEAMVRNLAGWADSNPPNPAPGTSPNLPLGGKNPDPSDTKFEEKVILVLPHFKRHVQAFYKGWKDFQIDFKRRATAAVLALIAAARERTQKMQKDLGIQSTTTASSNPTHTGMDLDTVYSSNAESMKKLSARAVTLKQKKKELDKWVEKEKDHYGTLHQFFMSADEIEKEGNTIRENLLASREAYQKEKAEAEGDFPILSHYNTVEQFETLSNPEAAAHSTGSKFDEILESLTTLENDLKASENRVFDIREHLDTIKRGLGCNEFESATVNYMREEYADSTATGTKVMTVMAIVVGAIAAAPSGGTSLVVVASLAEAGINTALMLQAIDEYSFQKALTTSDPDAAQALSKDEPSLFWLALNVVQTLVGLKGNVGQLTKAFGEIRQAYKMASITGETTELSRVLKNSGYSDDAAKSIVSKVLGEAKTLLEGIVKNGPEGIAAALNMIKDSPNFYGVRLAVWRLKAGTAEPAVKQNLQEARKQILAGIVEQCKAKYLKVVFMTVDQGFEKPLIVKLGSTEAPPAPPPPAPTAAPSSSPASSTLPAPAADQAADSKIPIPENATPVAAPPPGLLIQTSAKGAPAASAGPPVSSTMPAPNAGPAAASPMAGSLPASPASPQAASMGPGGERPPMAPAGAESVSAPLQAAHDIKDGPCAALDGAPAGSAIDLGIELDMTAAPLGPVNRDILEFYGIKGQPLPEYRGIFMTIGSNRFQIDREFTALISGEGTSAKYVLRDITTDSNNPALFVFKPGGREALLHPMYKADAGTYFIRGRVAYDIAMDLPTVGKDVIPMGIVVYDGAVGSLQPFVKNTKSLAKIRETDYELYRKIKDSQQFQKFNSNLQVYDYIINNPDRNPGNFLIEFGDNGEFKRIYAIDQDLALTPGARTVLDPAREVGPRLGTNIDPDASHLGKISKDLYDEMLMMRANKGSVKESLKATYDLPDAVVDSIFERLDNVVTDYSNRLATMRPEDVFF